MTIRIRSSLAPACLVALAVSVTGCAPTAATASDSTELAKGGRLMRPETARTEIVALQRATFDKIGGAWDEDTPWWNPCTAASGETGAALTLYAQRLGQPLDSSADETIRRVQSMWHERGIAATVWVDRSGSPENHYLSFPAFNTGKAPDGYTVSITAADAGPDGRGREQPGYADFGATSHCAAGDPDELNQQEWSGLPTAR